MLESAAHLAEHRDGPNKQIFGACDLRLSDLEQADDVHDSPALHGSPSCGRMEMRSLLCASLASCLGDVQRNRGRRSAQLICQSGVSPGEATDDGKGDLQELDNRARKSCVLYALSARSRCRARLLDQARRWHDVVPLAFGYTECQRQPQRVHDQVDLGRRPSSRTADAVQRRPPLPPAACW